MVTKFDNRHQAEEALQKEDTWSLNYYHETEEGKKKYYRCNKLKKRGPQCSAKMYLLLESISDSVLMFKANAKHDHDKKIEFSSSHGLTDPVKAEINKLFQLKMKPQEIMQNLTKMTHIKPPKISQLRNYLSIQRRAVNDRPTISLTELEAWILSHTKLPLNPHEVFIISYKIDETTFHFAISTKHLIEISKNLNVVHSDSRYKIIWQGFPVFVCGTTDQNQKFHPLCLVVTSIEKKEVFKLIFEGLQKVIQNWYQSTWSPKVLVCDGTKSIQNAFIEVFGDNVVVRTCWVHTKNKIQEWIKKLRNKELGIEILGDIDALHAITNPNIFDSASEAFLQKYKHQFEFIEYFKEHWLVQNRNWFLGAIPNSPSTNKALESFNKVIKDSDTVRKHLPLSRFLVVVKAIVNQWSTKYTTNPAKIPYISLKNWIESYQWAKLSKEVTLLHRQDNNYCYQIPAGQAQKCEIFEEQWKSFDDFKIQNFSKWVVSLPMEKNNWRQGNCNCPNFSKMYVCKHLIGLAIRLKYVVPPVEAQNIGEKRKRGRPSKEKKGLIIQ